MIPLCLSTSAETGIAVHPRSVSQVQSLARLHCPARPSPNSWAQVASQVAKLGAGAGAHAHCTCRVPSQVLGPGCAFRNGGEACLHTKTSSELQAAALVGRD